MRPEPAHRTDDSARTVVPNRLRPTCGTLSGSSRSFAGAFGAGARAASSSPLSAARSGSRSSSITGPHVEPPPRITPLARFTLQAARSRRQHRPPGPASDPAAMDLLVRRVSQRAGSAGARWPGRQGGSLFLPATTARCHGGGCSGWEADEKRVPRPGGLSSCMVPTRASMRPTGLSAPARPPGSAAGAPTPERCSSRATRLGPAIRLRSIRR